MVFARTKLLIYDYIFEPVKQIRISYIGPHPEKLYKKINELLRTVFNVPDAYVQEKVYNIEKGKDSERFEIDWEVTKLLDVFSYIAVELTLKGFSAAGEGKADITIKPRLITEYPQDTVWQKSIFYEIIRMSWHRKFYHKKRMQYLNMSKELIVTFEKSVKNYMDDLKAGKEET